MESKDNKQDILNKIFSSVLKLNPSENVPLDELPSCSQNIKQLVDQLVDIEKIDKFGSTLLINAVEFDDLEITKELLLKGANVNATLSCTGLTALDIACYKGNMEIVSSLIEAGANVNSANALIGAACYGHLNIVQLLLNSGANAQCESKIGLTALFYPCRNGHTDIVKLLVDNGAKVNHETKDGITPLMMACEADKLDIVRYLISKGANVNHKSKYAFCNLMLTDNKDIIEELLKHDQMQKSQMSKESTSTNI